MIDGALSTEHDVILGGLASGTGTDSTAWADLGTYRSMQFLLPIATAAAGARLEISIRQGRAFDGTGAVELGVLTAEDPGDERVLVAEVIRPEPHQGRFFALEIRRSVAASALGPVIVLRQGARSFPAPEGETVAGRLVLISPAGVEIVGGLA